ncbi:acyl-CoA carboxylase epsilon subunit [Streptomyces sp. NPDC093984]|uniref:acyl-CoA carboxylase epsilon subunit n=1 Tax=Streptomyces sp. NPDC093984 TaxID=3366052 RepID=UPI0037F76B09
MSARSEGFRAQDLLAAGSWRVVRGEPTAEEVAALALVLGAALSRRRQPAPRATERTATAPVALRRGEPWSAAATSWAAAPLTGRREAA